MRGKKDNTDRERLLKLIDGDVGALKEIRKRNTIKAVLRVLNELIYLVKQGTRQTFQKLRKGEMPFPRLNLASLKKALAVILPIMFMYLIFDFIGATLFKKSTIVLSAGNVTPKEASITRLSPLNYYLGEMVGKDIFNPERITLAKIKEEAASSSSPYAELKLAGVDWTGEPVALIEDTQTQKTHFVKKGQFIKELKVIEISRDSVKLQYENKIIELK